MVEAFTPAGRIRPLASANPALDLRRRRRLTLLPARRWEPLVKSVTALSFLRYVLQIPFSTSGELPRDRRTMHAACTMGESLFSPHAGCPTCFHDAIENSGLSESLRTLKNIDQRSKKTWHMGVVAPCR